MQQHPEQFFQDVRIVPCTPEKFVENIVVLEALLSLQNRGWLGRIIVDECHCLILYEHFRTSYDGLDNCILRHFPNIPVSFFTANSRRELRQKILRDFHINNASVVLGTVSRFMDNNWLHCQSGSVPLGVFMSFLWRDTGKRGKLQSLWHMFESPRVGAFWYSGT